MFCVIQKVMLKKPNPYGEYREIEVFPMEMTVNGISQTPIWHWRYTGGRFERPHLDAYKISIHQSYREQGKVKKHQYSICTMSYYDIVTYSLADCASGRIEATSERLGVDEGEIYQLIEMKLSPLRERLEVDYHQSEEYKTIQKHQHIFDVNNKARSAFCERYGVDGSEYDRCYDVFGALRNEAYLQQIIQQYRAYRSYRRADYSNYSDDSSSGYAPLSSSTYTEEETIMLKQFYRDLSKKYHPDLNPGKDTTTQMKLLNKLKETWRI